MKVERMQAAILVENKKPLVVADVELPEKLSFGQVLVKLHTSGICGAQINEIDGAKGPDKFLPHLLGHEGCADVLEVGEGVNTVRPGDRVVMHWRPSAGLQCQTPSYRWEGKKVNAGWVTTFNDHAVVSENRLTVISKDFDVEQAPLFGCAVTTAMGVINNDAQVKVGQSVVVVGAGGVGLNLVQSAAMVSANPIVAIDVHDEKLEMARRFGATACFNAATTKDLDAAVREVVGRDGADVVVETTGKARVIEQAYAMTHKDGKTILVGVPTKGDDVTIYTLPLHFEKVLKGSHGGEAKPDLEIPRYIRLIENGRMTLDGIVTHRFRLEQINEAIDLVREGKTGRVLIDYR